MPVTSSGLWERAKPGGRSEADMQRAEAWRAEANVRREGMGIPEAGAGEFTVDTRDDHSQKRNARLLEDHGSPA